MEKVQCASFVMAWDKPALYIQQSDGSLSTQRSNFAIELLEKVEAQENTGFLANIKQATDGQQKVCFFTLKSTSRLTRFMCQINSSFGSGLMTLVLDSKQFAALIRQLKSEQMAQSLPTKKGSFTTGLQPCGDIWVFTKDIQMNNDGEGIRCSDSPYVLLDNSLIKPRCKLSDIYPKIQLPLSVSPMRRLLRAMKAVLRHNFVPSLLTVAGAVMAMHYQRVVAVNSGCPAVILTGRPETGKTLSIKCALSILGAGDSYYSYGTNAYFMYRASMSSLPFAIDVFKAKRGSSFDVTKLIIDLFDGRSAVHLKSRPNHPITTALIETDLELQNEPRIEKKAVVIKYMLPTVGGFSGFSVGKSEEIRSLCSDTSDVSGAIGWAVAIGKNLDHRREDVRRFCDMLDGKFAGYVQQNWGVLLYFLDKLLQEAGDQLRIGIDDVLDHIQGLPERSKRPREAHDFQHAKRRKQN